MAPTPPDYAARVRGAIVSAAVGDALGWPQETRSNIVGGQKARNIRPEPQFRAWDRNSGTQFARYRETIEAGEYSDDTQLLLAVARSSMAGDHWFDWFTRIELPAWTLYQRGAGRAVIAAGRYWAADHAPWTDGHASRNGRGTDQLVSYFNAGANGVAMRIAPHVIVTINDDPRELLRRVVADGIATHGHPRALVGAALHALAMRYALSRQGTLEYGDLLVALMDEYSWQSSDWLDAALPTSWLKSYVAATGRSIETAWVEVVAETMELLRIAHRSLARAALANDEETLGTLGCYDKSRNGAGTVTAVAAAYIAARTAARPMSGLLRAAFLPRADTDTLASMTASLLGAIHGTGWLGLLADHVQDSPYLHRMSMLLADVSSRPSVGRPDLLYSDPATFAMHGIRARDVDRYRRRLFDSKQALPNEFVDRQPIAESDRFTLAEAGAVSVARARLRTLDGQLLIIDDLSRAGQSARIPRDSGARGAAGTTSDAVAEVLEVSMEAGVTRARAAARSGHPPYTVTRGRVSPDQPLDYLLDKVTETVWEAVTSANSELEPYLVPLGNYLAALSVKVAAGSARDFALGVLTERVRQEEEGWPDGPGERAGKRGPHGSTSHSCLLERKHDVERAIYNIGKVV